MSNKELEQIAEIRSVHTKMQELQKAASAAQSNVLKQEKAFEKSKQKLDEAKAALKDAELEVSNFAVEQKKAMQKVMAMIAKDPSLAHDLLGAALSMTPNEQSN